MLSISKIQQLDFLCKQMANVTRSDNAILGVILALFGETFGDHIWKYWYYVHRPVQLILLWAKTQNFWNLFRMVQHQRKNVAFSLVVVNCAAQIIYLLHYFSIWAGCAVQHWYWALFPIILLVNVNNKVRSPFPLYAFHYWFCIEHLWRHGGTLGLYLGKNYFWYGCISCCMMLCYFQDSSTF